MKQICLRGKGDGGLGLERERMVVLLLPYGQFARERQRLVMVADEIVIDDEDLVAPSQFAQGVELRDELRVRLGAGLAAVDGDDVAELALEGAATRKLHRHGGVFVEAQQIEA